MLLLLAAAPQQAITLPPGTTLPIALPHSLHAGKLPQGTAVRAHTTQRLPLPGDQYLPAGVEVLGTVTSQSPHLLTLHFTVLRYKGQTVPITTRALALANFTDVADTAHPASGSPDRGNPSPASWTTQQVGGDQVVRSGWSGPVVNPSTRTVGSADFYGVYTLPTPGQPPHALGVFSTSARGLFGFDRDCALDSPGPVATVRCQTSKASLHSGDNLLLEVLPPSTQP